MDTPGVLAPKIEDGLVGLKLGIVGPYLPIEWSYDKDRRLCPGRCSSTGGAS